MTRRRLFVVIGAVVVGAALAALMAAGSGTAPRSGATVPASYSEESTSRADLERLTRELDAALMREPNDAPTAARLAELLIRRARVESNGGYLAKAEQVLEAALDEESADQHALRMLGVVRLSQHRFLQAIEVAERAVKLAPNDAFTFGVLGDAHLELGHYDQAFAAFDRMVELRPGAPAYARIAYAHELQGRLPEALAAMRMALSATGPRDVESLAWHHAQLGNLHLQMEQWDDAAREFAHADFVFPGHPYAQLGRARLAWKRGDVAAAIEAYRSLVNTAPTSDAARDLAVLLRDHGNTHDAAAMFARAEALEREAWMVETPQPANLARILLEAGTRVDEAVELAERAAASRADIFTMDTLGWAYHRAGRNDAARRASLQALRTGTRDANILAHAAAIAAHTAGR